MGNTAIKGDKNTSGFTPRNKKGTPKIFKNIGWYFAILIVVLLIIVMAVPSFGIFSGSRQGEEYVFGKFADREIKFASGSYMATTYNNILQQYSQYFNAEQISSMQMQIMQQAFQSASLQTAFDYYASKYGINISEKEVDDYLRNNYKDDKGNFNASSWKNLSASGRANIRASVTNELVGKKLSDLYKASPISEGEIEALRVYKQGVREKEYEEQKEKDSREGITTEEKQAEIVNVTEKEVISSIRDNTQDRFYSSVLESKLLEDNFVTVYTSKILPLMTQAEDNAAETALNTEDTETATPETEASTSTDTSVSTDSTDDAETENASDTEASTAADNSSST